MGSEPGEAQDGAWVAGWLVGPPAEMGAVKDREKGHLRDRWWKRGESEFPGQRVESFSHFPPGPLGVRPAAHVPLTQGT